MSLRNHIIRLAATCPAGSPLRSQLLAVLKVGETRLQKENAIGLSVD